MIDWQAFADCICSTAWSRPVDLKNQLGLSQSTTMAAWHGKPIGLVPFLRICRAMKIEASNFLQDEPAAGGEGK